MSANKVKKAVKFEEAPSPQGYAPVGSIIIYAHVVKEYKPNSTNLKDQVDTIIEQPNQEEEDDEDDSSSDIETSSEGLDDVDDEKEKQKLEES